MIVVTSPCISFRLSAALVRLQCLIATSSSLLPFAFTCVTTAAAAATKCSCAAAG